MRQSGAAHADHADDVYIQYPMRLIVDVGRYIPRCTDTGGVDDNVERAVVFDDCRSGCVDLRGVGDVADDCQE